MDKTTMITDQYHQLAAARAETLDRLEALTAESAEAVKALHAQGVPVTTLAKTWQVTRPTIYNWIKGEQDND